MAEGADFFNKRWQDQMTRYRATYTSAQKNFWKLGDIALEVDKGSRKSFHSILYSSRGVDISFAQFDHYIQTADAFPPATRNLKKAWNVHFKLRKEPDRHTLINSDEIKNSKDVDDLVKSRKEQKAEEKAADDADKHRNEGKDSDEEQEQSFHEVWEQFTAHAEESLSLWLRAHVNWELDLEHVMKIREDSKRLMDAWAKAVDSDFNDTLELQVAYEDARAMHEDKIPF